jgi:hypothetical protein
MMIKKQLATLVSSSLMLLSIALNTNVASASGLNQVAAHFDWGGATLSPTVSISQSFTPHSVPKASEGQVDWSLNLGNSTSNLSASITLLSTGAAVWQFMDVPGGSKVMNIDSARCELQSGNAYGTPGASRSICTTPLSVVAGETYTFTIKYWDNNGSKWWVASVNVKSTGQNIQLGRLENNASASVMNASLSMYAHNQTSFYKVPLPSCSAIPNFSITYGPLKNSGSNQPNLTGTRNATNCPTIGSFDLNTPEKYRINIGSKSSSFVNEINEVRQPRALDQIPRPASLLIGLHAVTYTGYFNDDPSWLSRNAVNIKSRRTHETLPSFSNEPFSSLGLMTAMYSGYIIPDVAGTWKFRIRSDDAVFMWLGNEAIVNYAGSTLGAQLRIPGTHEPITREFTTNLVKDKVYPLRIMYGNAASFGTFEFSLMPPGFNSYQTDTTGLFFHSEPNYCTSWGIEMALMAKLGFEKYTYSSQCGTPASELYPGMIGPSSTSSSSSSNTNNNATASTKKAIVNKPTFSLINVVGNKLNLSVNLGSAGSSRPDNVYLVAPKLGILDSNKLFGNVSGSKANWSIDFDKLLAGATIPLKVVGVKNGVESDAVEQNFNAPDPAKLIVSSSAPVTPKNVKSRIVGSSAVITAESTLKAGALATSAYIFGTSLGVPVSEAILGEVFGTKVLFEVPLKSSMAGKSFPFTIYLQNEVGKSQPVQGTLSVPAAPKIPSGSIQLPTQKNAPRTIFCLKGSQTRTFAAKSCPPGWKSA